MKRATASHAVRGTLVALACVVLAACGSPDTGPKTGSPAPRFEATDIDGSVRRFPEDYAGRPVILDFWADWCRYCVGHMQRVDALQREHAESGLAVIAINVAQDRSTAAAFLDKLGVGFSSVLDPDSRITKQYGVQGLPITYFVDKEGRIAGKIIGEADEKLLNSQLSRILPAPQ